jgi:hypothetical protein
MWIIPVDVAIEEFPEVTITRTESSDCGGHHHLIPNYPKVLTSTSCIMNIFAQRLQNHICDIVLEKHSFHTYVKALKL